ncbi:ABC transporter substrate-binding protein [Paenibacillus sp. NPDC056579]|uniref:ABC transporter substrate-binding protein n=1 Tax=Paenibacillus sp. NPDC056579 TaxID=3345871 RepID=UPI00367F096F
MVTKSTAVKLGSSVMVLALLAACGGQPQQAVKGPESSTPTPAKPPEPVTLTFYTKTVLDDFEKYINQYVKKKFPHVTLNLVKNEKGSMIEELVAAGNIPDIIWEGVTNIQTLTPLDLPLDLRPLAQKHGLDLGVYDSKLLDSIKSYSKNGELYYLPYNTLAFALHYNKDIFDKFGVPYPTNNMTWSQVIELSKKLTRSEDGVNYIGMRPPLGLNRMQMQMGLSYADPKTETAAVTTEGWKNLFETVKMMYPPSVDPPIKSLFAARDEFLANRTVAMLPDILLLHNTDMAKMEKEGLKWDFVSYPTFKDNVGQGLFSDGFILPKGGKNTDLAFQIIAYLSSNPDVQLDATKNGRLTGLKDPAIQKQLFANNEAAKGKNFTAVLSQKYPDPAQATIYDRDGSSIMNGKLLNYINGTADVNTLLREGQEALDKKITELKASKK